MQKDSDKPTVTTEPTVSEADEIDALISSVAQISLTPTKSPSKFVGANPNVQWKAIPVEILHQHDRFVHPTDIVQQRSEEWFALRRHRLTGSQFANALGFFDKQSCKLLGLKPQTYHHSDRVHVVYSNIKEPKEEVFDTAQRVFMDWGMHHESNAIITYLDEFKDHVIQETTFYTIDNLEEYINKHATVSDFDFVKDFSILKIGASPDGIVVKDNLPDSVLEIKCPTAFIPDSKSQDFRYMKRKPHAAIPVYYIPQLMGEMMVTGLRECTFCSWTITAGMNVFRVGYDQAYVNEMLYWFYQYAQLIHGTTTVTDPSMFEGAFAENDRYKNFLAKTLEIAGTAVLIKTVEKSAVGQLNKNIFHT